MTYGAKLRFKWKAKVLNWAEALSGTHSKPVAKLVAEVSSGILASGSLQLTEIARALKEPKRLHHTVKRLSRMLEACFMARAGRPDFEPSCSHCD